MAVTKRVEYMCTYCGRKVTVSIGRPSPGNCTRKPRDANGRLQPHSWVKNREL